MDMGALTAALYPPLPELAGESDGPPAPSLLPSLMTVCARAVGAAPSSDLPEPRGAACRNAARVLCRSCRLVAYCSEACQLAAWPQHRAQCWLNSSPLRVERQGSHVARDVALDFARRRLVERDYATAERTLASLVRTLRDDPEVLVEFGHCLAARGTADRRARAERMLRTAVALPSASPRHRAALAYFLHHAAQVDHAPVTADALATEARTLYAALADESAAEPLSDPLYLADFAALLVRRGEGVEARAVLARALAAETFATLEPDAAAGIRCAYARVLEQTAVFLPSRASAARGGGAVVDDPLACVRESGPPWALMAPHYEAVLASPPAVAAAHVACCGVGLASARFHLRDASAARRAFDRLLEWEAAASFAAAATAASRHGDSSDTVPRRDGSRAWRVPAGSLAQFAWLLASDFSDVAAADQVFARAVAEQTDESAVVVARFWGEFLHAVRRDNDAAVRVLRPAVLYAPAGAVQRAYVEQVLALLDECERKPAIARARELAGPIPGKVTNAPGAQR